MQSVESPAERPLTWAEINGRPYEQIHQDGASWENVHPGGADAYAAQIRPQEG